VHFNAERQLIQKRQLQLNPRRKNVSVVEHNFSELDEKLVMRFAMRHLQTFNRLLIENQVKQSGSK